MNQKEFNYLVVNVNCLSEIQFASGLNDLIADLSDELGEFGDLDDFGEMDELGAINHNDKFQQAYESVNGTENQLSKMYHSAALEKITQLLTQLPEALSPLTSPLTGTDLDQWIQYDQDKLGSFTPHSSVT
jgi:hypothetical protein